MARFIPGAGAAEYVLCRLIAGEFINAPEKLLPAWRMLQHNEHIVVNSCPYKTSSNLFDSLASLADFAEEDPGKLT